MTYQVKSFAALSSDSDLVPHTVERRETRADDVVIDILFCGVCHSDLHQARNDWGGSTYPMVPGHEIVGRVKEVGADITKFKVGDLVGVGCMVDSCRECAPCQAGEEQYCEQGHIQTYNYIDPKDGMMTYGGYSKAITVTQDFVLKVPETLDLQGVPPLLCAGITTWSPLRHWKVGKGSKVVVVGLGGLGHMAIKLAHALGAEVTLFSRSPEKTQDALRLGASRVVNSTDSEQMKSVANTFDLIVDTVPYAHDISAYVATLALNGTHVFVGYLGNIMQNTVPMIMGRKSVAGSVIGGIRETQELLDFCGEHNITADVELIEMPAINQTFERMLKSDVKYRFVIDMQKF